MPRVIRQPYYLVTLHEAYHTDESGRRSSTIGYFTTEKFAEEARAGLGLYECYTGQREVKAILVDGEYFLLVKSTPIDVDNIKAAREASLKRSAKAKLKKAGLTEAEQRVLGLDKSRP